MLQMTLWTLQRRGTSRFLYPLPQGAMYGAGLWARGQGNFPRLTGKALPAQSTQEVATSEHRDARRLASLAERGCLFVPWAVSGGGRSPKASLLLPSGFLWSSGAAGALLQGHPRSACAVLPGAAGKGGHRAALRATLLPSGAAISPLPSAPLKKSLPQLAGCDQTQLLWGESLAEG